MSVELTLRDGTSRRIFAIDQEAQAAQAIASRVQIWQEKKVVDFDDLEIVEE